MAKAKKNKDKKLKKAKAQAECGKPTSISPDRFDEMRAALQARVKASRYRHSMGVSQTAEQLARIYGVDQNEAAVAGLLHDWDKSLTSDELKRKAKKLKLAGKQVREHATGVLHSWTAAATLRDEFPELSDAVLQAISRHTCGAVGMTDLDMVVFVADIIEPGRDFPDIQGLREAVGEVSLDELFYRTYKANFMYLLSADMVVAPPSLDVYNSLVVARKKRLTREQAAKAESAVGAAMQSLADEIARREQLAHQAEQQMALARKAAQERDRVREEKRAHMQAEHAERYAEQSPALPSRDAEERAAAARVEAVEKAKAEAAKRAAAKVAAQRAQAGAHAGQDGAAEETTHAAKPAAPERTPSGARIIPIE